MSKPKITWQIEYSLGSGQYGWSRYHDDDCAISHSEDMARNILASLRYQNLHRDDKTRAQTRPCAIWTPDGTWASYTSAGTMYRLVKITKEVMDEEDHGS